MKGYTYSEQGFGGIGFRLDVELDSGRYHSYTTNPDGTGMFYHDGNGNRSQTAGNGQFRARSLASFRRKTRRTIDTYEAGGMG